jgi:hypothetical protein
VYRLPPDAIDAPAIMLTGFEISPMTFAQRTDTVAVELTVAVSRRHVDKIDELDELLSPTGDASLWALFDEDATLGGVVGYCVVQSVGDYRQVMVNDVGFYAASVQLTVML